MVIFMVSLIQKNEEKRKKRLSWTIMALLLILGVLLLLDLEGCPSPKNTNPDDFSTKLYTILGSSGSFEVRSGSEIIGSGEIQTVINSIRTHADGGACSIQLGDGTNILNINSEQIDFNNTGGIWGMITLSGKITSSRDSSPHWTIRLADNVSATSTADIAATGIDAWAIDNTGKGVLKINGGIISSISGSSAVAVMNSDKGTVNISGGTIMATTYVSVYNRGILNIIDGTISSSTGRAVFNEFAGVANISGGKLEAIGDYGRAVHHASTGTLIISNGTITANTGSNSFAVFDAGTGEVTINSPPAVINGRIGKL